MFIDKLRPSEMYPCLFRFEDYFEPEGTPNKDNLDECILRHIRGEKSYFYSYGVNFIPCMLKYYHAPTPAEEISLSVHFYVEPSVGLYVGNFKDYEEAKAYYNNPLFPEESYPSIQDGEVLAYIKLDPSKTFRFGYAVYFLVLLTLLGTEDPITRKDLERYRLVLEAHKDEWTDYGFTSITDEDMQTAIAILCTFQSYKSYKPTKAEILAMPIWASTFEKEQERNNFLVRMLNS